MEIINEQLENTVLDSKLLDKKVLNTDDVSHLFDKNIEYYEQLTGHTPEFDLLKLYFGEDYIVNDRITIHQPSIQNIIDIGETNFYATIAPFTTNPTAFRVQLDDLGIDWNDITDFELFALLIKTISLNNTKIFFDDIDFHSFDLVAKNIETENGIEQIPILYSEKHDMEIDEETYLKIRKYLCYMFNVTLEEEHVKSKSLRKEILAKARADNAKRLAEQKSSSLVEMISFALNHPGFKYKKNELRDICYIEFIDSIKRLQIYESTRALMQGNYSGFCDTSKIPEEMFNFMRKC